MDNYQNWRGGDKFIKDPDFKGYIEADIVGRDLMRPFLLNDNYKTCDLQCKEGYIIKYDENIIDVFEKALSQKCTPCSSNCKACSGNIGNCTKCYDQYFLDETKSVCMPCHQNCKTCDKNALNCTSCWIFTDFEKPAVYSVINNFFF